MTEPFTLLRLSQLETLRRLDSARCWDVFTILARENFWRGGKPFSLPIDELATQKGRSRSNLRLTLRRLETSGLILVQRRPPQPPLIKVL